jgi:TusA-related sulfurtransferase
MAEIHDSVETLNPGDEIEVILFDPMSGLPDIIHISVYNDHDASKSETQLSPDQARELGRKLIKLADQAQAEAVLNT